MIDNKSYATINQRYINTGGHCMVLVTAVYDKQKNQTIYVTINEEGYSITTADFITSEIENLIDNFPIGISNDNWDNVDFRLLTDDVHEMISDCYQQYLIHEVKDSKHNEMLYPAQVPIELYKHLSADYLKWLDDNDQLVETDGTMIILNSNYEVPVAHAQYILDCKELLDYINAEFAKTNRDDANEAWEIFNGHQAVIGFGNKHVILQNGAAVYEALTDALEYIIDQE